MRGEARRASALWLLPAMLMLALGFIVPLGIFFVKTLLLEPLPLGLWGTVAQVLSSPATLNAAVATNWIALAVTLGTLVVGYPIAWYLANRRGLVVTLVVFSVVVPYFTSVIVRTYSWMVLLGRNGVVNHFLQATGIADAPLPLIYNKPAIIASMGYVLLPYMILTLYATMRAIDPAYMRAARSLGASAGRAFLRVYLPLSIAGVLSGSLIVFILAIGFFVTPALMGGPGDVMMAMLIQEAVEVNLDWPTAAILSLLLLAVTLVLYAVYFRVAGLRRLLGGAGRGQ